MRIEVCLSSSQNEREETRNRETGRRWAVSGSRTVNGPSLKFRRLRSQKLRDGNWNSLYPSMLARKRCEPRELNVYIVVRSNEARDRWTLSICGECIQPVANVSWVFSLDRPDRLRLISNS